MGRKREKRARKQRDPKGLVQKSKVRLLAVLTGAVCIAVLVTHLPALSAQAMSFDDNMYLTDNELVLNPGWASAKRFITEVLEPSTVRGYYQPLTMISLMLDCAMGAGPENLMPIHRTSLFFHMANTFLVIVLLYMLFGRVWIAAAVGLLFGLHPLTVELVAWVSDRKDLLATFFTLWSFIFYIRFARSKNRKYYAASLAVYVLALMSKPTSIPFPVLLLLMDFWPMRRLSFKTVPEKIPFFAAAGIFAVITVISQARTALVIVPGQYGYDLGRIPLILCHNVVFYLFKIIRPVNLSLFYPFPEPFGLSDPMILAGVVGSGILVVVLVISLRWTPVPIVGWLFFFVAILPTMNLIKFTKVIAADRYAYFPAFGLMMILASFLIWLVYTAAGTKRRAVGAAVAAVVLLLACGEAVATRRYLAHWKDTIGFFRHILTITPNAPQVHKALAFTFQSRGRSDDAIKHYERALELNSDDVKAANNLGDVLASQGRTDEAIGWFRRALEIYPDYVVAHNNLANALEMQGRIDQAVRHYRRALRIEPDNADVHYNLANALYSHGRLDEAVGHYKSAVQIRPDDVSTRCNLADTLRVQGKLDEAISQYRRALQIEPENVMTLNGLAWVLVDDSRPHLDRAAEAIALAGRAAELTRHENPVILNTLARAYAAAGQPDKAEKIAQQALKLASASQNQELVDYIRRQLGHYSQQRP